MFRRYKATSRFGDCLRDARQARRMSQQVLAESAGVDHTLISRLESGERNPTEYALWRVCAALGLTEAERDRLYLEAHITPPGLDTETLARLVAQAREEAA